MLSTSSSSSAAVNASPPSKLIGSSSSLRYVRSWHMEVAKYSNVVLLACSDGNNINPLDASDVLIGVGNAGEYEDRGGNRLALISDPLSCDFVDCLVLDSSIHK
ncbi:hypothetical protein OGATHE_000383 [Ogataea polymorpha]|uniref:Uncharacterized protein n=1 Tax=Ogataea polymorpha TaxID=460523 RepID=A0A9P8PUY1_9ASCO|nr:hypothetical protein OGATHE_000383 [Ogataea polymorpha]